MGGGVPPAKDMVTVEVLWDGDGVPPALERIWNQWKYYGMEIGPVEVLWDEDGVPPSPVNGQTPVKTLSSQILLEMRAVTIMKMQTTGQMLFKKQFEY